MSNTDSATLTRPVKAAPATESTSETVDGTSSAPVASCA